MNLNIFVKEWTNGRFSLNAGQYKGLPPSVSILNSMILEQIYEGIHAEFDRDAAKSFVRMVNSLSDLSATAFITELYRLEENDWHFEGQELHTKRVAPVLSARDTVRLSREIKFSFILKHGSEILERTQQASFA